MVELAVLKAYIEFLLDLTVLIFLYEVFDSLD